MIYENKDQLKKGCESILAIDGGDVRVLNEARFREKLIDDLIYTLVFSPDPATSEAAGFLIRRGAASAWNHVCIDPIPLRSHGP